MAFAWIVRRSAATLAPIASRVARTRPNLHHLSTISPIVHRSSVSENPSPPPFAFPSFLYSTSTATDNSSSDQALLRVIDSEIKCALESEDHDVVEETPEGFPFEIEDNPGHRTVKLTREYNGEQIKVEVHMPGLVSGEDEDDMDDDDNGGGSSEKSNQSSIPLVVTITKKSGLSLEFSCTAFPDEIAIDGLSVRHPENSTEEQMAYEGPDFHDLDENLRKTFHKYLDIRGIKASTTNYLHEYMINKDSREFLRWLKNLKKFIEG